MTNEEVQQLKQARESMARRRSDLAKIIAQAPLVSVETAEELTKIQHAIEAVDRALADAGQPYLSPGFAGAPEA
jgi:ABC-type transporter Mla subunit MlaD